MMTFSTLTLAVALAACSSPSTGGTDNASATATETTTAAASTAQTDVASPKHLNGITERNAGDATGKVNLNGTIARATTGQVILYAMEGRNKSELARTPLENGAFAFKKLEVSRGVYTIALDDDKNATEILLNPDESEITLNFASNRLSGQKTAPNSPENTGYWSYQEAETQNRNAIRGLRKNIAEAGAFRARVEQQIADKEMELVKKQHELIGQYPDTYLAKLLTWKNPRYPENQSRFFEDIDPLDNSAMRSMALSDRIQQFMVTYSKGTDSGFLACIDQVKAHFEPNPVTLESALYSMLEGFYNTGKETICQYILDNYIFDEDCGADLSDAIRIRAQGIINLQVGNTPPNFAIATPEGNVIDLMQTCSQHAYTLVMFWASWCHKCEQEMPYVGPMYAKYNFKGLEVIGVSLDQNAKTWTEAIEAKGMTWPQVSQLEAWNSPVVEAYKVTATPTYFLLDREGKIVLKPERAFEVDNFLKDKL